MSMSCEYKKSTVADFDDWIRIYIEANDAAVYLDYLYKIAMQITKDLIDAKDMAEATKHFDFTTSILNTIHRLEAEKEGD